ncbi:MAG: S8 family serine peptidase, partial [Candidatus Woesearchaeota archaeon]|nr:S8 family serine peptidase [Candidatus Woesearchaeota archaeon]
MKIGILGAILIFIAFAFVSTTTTADFDVSAPSDAAIEIIPDIQETVATVSQEVQKVPDVISQESSYYIISYSTADIAASQKVLQQQLEIIYYIPDHQYLVHASAKDLEQLQKKGFVLDYTLVRENSQRYLLGTDPKETLYYVYAFRERDVKAIVEQLKDLGYVIVDTNTYVLVVDFADMQDVENALQEIVQIEGVEAAEQRPHYELLNDVTNVVVGTTDIRQRFGLYGAGQIIAIADTGLDTGILSTLHPDIRGRVISLTENVYDPVGNCQGIGPTNDPQGHGTAVTGAAVGNGLQSGSNPSQHSYPLGSYTGSAPEARLVFQAVGCNQGGISAQLPLTRYPPTYNLGARVYSESFVSGVQDGGYYFLDRDKDQYTNTRKNFVITAGAGNANNPSTTTNNAKNVVTIGGFIRDQSTTQIYARGPTKDGRYKPDILSAAGASLGTGITTTYSSVQTLPGCSQLTSNSEYCGLS